MTSLVTSTLSLALVLSAIVVEAIVFAPVSNSTIQRIKRSGNLEDYVYGSYLSFEKMESRLASLEAKYSDHLTLERVGESVQGRHLYLVKITDNRVGVPRNGCVYFKSEDEETLRDSSQNRLCERSTDKPIVFVDGGIHAREWVSPAAAFYLIDKLLETPDLTRDLEWWIMPMVNPDGYSFSRTRGNRLWRKNRAKTGRRGCFGVDLNRNFDINWKKTNRNPCSETYGGPSVFSEPESRAVRDTLINGRDRVQAYVTLHTYGQYILYPYGYTKYKQPPTLQKLKSMAKGMADAIYKKYSNSYRVTSASVFGAAAGGSDDWAYAKMNIPYSFTFELQDRNFNYQVRGFILPVAKLPQAVDECWIGLKHLGERIIAEAGTTNRIADPTTNEKEEGRGEEKEEEEKEEEEEEDEDDEEEEVEILDLPVGWAQLVQEVKRIQAELKANSTEDVTKNCVRKGSMYICPHMVFWGSIFEPPAS